MTSAAARTAIELTSIYPLTLCMGVPAEMLEDIDYLEPSDQNGYKANKSAWRFHKWARLKTRILRLCWKRTPIKRNERRSGDFHAYHAQLA